MFYEWNTKEDFDAWHSSLCIKLGYPIIGINAETGLPDESSKTTEYTRSSEIEGKWIAEVEEKYAEGLTPTMLKPTAISFTI
jgi:hypothetical protein